MPRILKRKAPENSEPRLIDQVAISLDVPVDLAVLAVKKIGMRCKHISSGLPVTYRMVRDDIEGEIITVAPSKVWQFKNTVYLTGKTIHRRLDIAALNLTPLKLVEQGMFEPAQEPDIFEADDPFAKYYQPILAYGPRREYEMEQVIPFENPEDWDSDPITQAVDAAENGDYGTARQIIEEVLAEDLRCIDAHAHLGNWEFDIPDFQSRPYVQKAQRHYSVGVRIAEMSLGENFHDLLPWAYIDNRPYLRCMHGLGLCFWRGGNFAAAREIFEKMLWLNPRDNQGARFLLSDIDAGKTWQSEQENDGSPL
jgi:hypothetical protein